MKNTPSVLKIPLMAHFPDALVEALQASFTGIYDMIPLVWFLTRKDRNSSILCIKAEMNVLFGINANADLLPFSCLFIYHRIVCHNFNNINSSSRNALIQPFSNKLHSRYWLPNFRQLLWIIPFISHRDERSYFCYKYYD